jgi:hypothetical protein
MSIRWDEFPHDLLRLRIYKRHAQNATAQSAQSSLVHILRRKLPARNSEDHRRFVELQAARLIEHLRCTRDIYQDFVNERRCDPVLEAHWVVLRCAVLPTAIELLRQDVIEYTNITQVPARDLSLLFGLPTHVCYKDTSNGFGVVYPPNIDDTTVADDTELESLGKLVEADTLLHFKDIKDGGAVFRLFGGGPFAVDDDRSIHSSWSLCGLQKQFTLIQWVHERERLWRICSPWSEGLDSMFTAVQEELLAQHSALPVESSIHLLEIVEKAFGLHRIVVPRGWGTSEELGSPRPAYVDANQEQDRRGLDARRAAIIRKVSQPQHYRILMVEEATLYFQVTSRTIYRWLDIGKLCSGPRRGSITIKSIRRFEAQRSQKRDSNGS